MLGVLLFGLAAGFYTLAESQAVVDPLADYDLMSLAFRSAKGVSGWLMVAGIIGLFDGSRHHRPAVATRSDRTSLVSRISEYTAEAVLPVYILHQTVIVLLAFYVVAWPIPAVVKYLTISLVSLAAILVIYDVGVRRTRLTRFLFGMK